MHVHSLGALINVLEDERHVGLRGAKPLRSSLTSQLPANLEAD